MTKPLFENQIAEQQLSVHNRHDIKKIVNLGKALSSTDRIRILSMLAKTPMNLYELSVNLAIPFSSVYHHVNILVNAGLVITNFKPTPKGHEKICSAAIHTASVNLISEEASDDEVVIQEMPVGMYRDCEITPPCGLLSSTGRIGTVDDPSTFYSPQTSAAEIIWFNCGYVSYCFPHNKRDWAVKRISFSFELCSETMFYNNEWKSDIFVEINDKECTTFTSLGDYGGRRGNFTPEFWPITSTQYGRLYTLCVDEYGVHLNNTKVNDKITLKDLQLQQFPFIKFKLGVKQDAVHCGGVNLFGKNFGDYNQSIVMSIAYDNQKKYQ